MPELMVRPPDMTPRPHKQTRIYLGCAAAFLGLFLLVGVFVVAAMLAGSSESKLPALAVGFAFILVPAGGLFLVRWLWTRSAEREHRKMLAPDQPWTWDQDVSGGIVSGASPTLSVVVWVLFAGSWLGFMAVVTAVGWTEIRRQTGLMAFIGVFWAVGLFLASMAVKSILQARRFGRSTLALDATPARLGGWLSGVIRAPLAVQEAQLQVTVECIKTTYNYRASSSGSSTSRYTMWRTTRVLDGARCARLADTVEIPFAIRLPTNDAVAKEQGNNVLASIFGASQFDLVGQDISWHLAVKGRLSGVDYADGFLLPVAAPAAGAAPVSAAPPREMPELEGEALAQRMPAQFEARQDADVFVFPVKTSSVIWTLMFFAPALVCGAQYLQGGIPLADQMSPQALFWTGIVTGGLGVLCLLGLMLETRSIEVAPQEVRVRRGLLGVGFHRTIPRTDIATIEEEPSRSDPPTYSVNIKTRDGTSYWAALALSQPDQAKALATRLRDVLQIAAKS
jgi:hypothetical protein